MNFLKLVALTIGISSTYIFLDALIELQFRGKTSVLFIEPVPEIRIIEIALWTFSMVYLFYEIYKELREGG